MNRYLVFFLFLVSFNSYSEKTFYLSDANQDQKIDYKVTYSNGDISLIEIDYNFDGKFDFIEKRINKKRTEKKWDKNFDGKFDFKIISDVLGQNIQHKYLSIKSNKEDIIEIKTFPIIIANTEKDNCVLERENVLSYFENFVQDFQQVMRMAGGEFETIARGIDIHSSCYQNIKKEKFHKLIKNGVTRGVSCLEQLASNKIDSPKREEIFNLLDQFKMRFEFGPNVQIACGGQSLNWHNILGYGSSGEIQDFGEYGLRHPLVLMNSEIKSGFWGGLSLDRKDIDNEKYQGVVFHEMIHNFGHQHNEGIDYSYACESCCFKGSKLKSKDLNSASCRICQGDYDNEFDPNYIKDLAQTALEGDTLVYLMFLGSRKDELIWNDHSFESLLAYYKKQDSNFLHALFPYIKPLFNDKNSEQKWDEFIENSGKGRKSLQEFNDQVARFFYAFYIKNDEVLAYKELAKLDARSIVNTVSGSTMGMGHKINVEKSISTLKNILNIARANAKTEKFRTGVGIVKMNEGL